MNALLASHASLGVSGARVSSIRVSGIGVPGRVNPPAGAARSSWVDGAGSRPVARLSLTRRGRLVFFGIPAIAMAALLLFVSLAIVAGSTAAPAHASSQQQSVNLSDYAVAVTVLQGDSLWSIAGAADPTRDVRHVVREIIALNDLGSGVLQAGQRILVPLRK